MTMMTRNKNRRQIPVASFRKTTSTVRKLATLKAGKASFPSLDADDTSHVFISLTKLNNNTKASTAAIQR